MLIHRIDSLLARTSARLSWLPPLVARLSLGWVFVESGWGKWHNLPKVIEYFTSLGIPAPQLQAPFVASVELVGGCLLILGLGARVASVFLSATMVVAILTARRGDINELSDLLGMQEYLFLVVFLWLIVGGAGGASVDRIVARRFR
jgi:putative oxidoreductase